MLKQTLNFKKIFFLKSEYSMRPRKRKYNYEHLSIIYKRIGNSQINETHHHKKTTISIYHFHFIILLLMFLLALPLVPLVMRITYVHFMGIASFLMTRMLKWTSDQSSPTPCLMIHIWEAKDKLTKTVGRGWSSPTTPIRTSAKENEWMDELCESLHSSLCADIRKRLQSATQRLTLI